jgi:membrane protease YdiL (CAAX protease family)
VLEDAAISDTSPPGVVPDSPPPPRVHPLERVAAAAEVFLCSGLPTQLLLIGILSFSGMSMRTEGGQLSPPFVFVLSILDTLLLVALVWFLLRSHRESPRRVLFGERPILREAILGAALLPVIFVGILMVLLLILAVVPRLHNVPRNPLEDMLQTRGDAIVFGFVAMFAGGVREEVQRGFILHRFDRFLGGGTVGVIVFSMLFGLGHIDQGYDAAIATGLLGAFWGILYLTRRSIVAPMVSHAGFNLAQLAKYIVIAR